jgi:hypothetical protein
MALCWLLTPANRKYEKARLSLLHRLSKDNGLYDFLSVPIPALNAKF